MAEWISNLAGQPVVLAVLLLLAVVMVYGILKRLFKLALFMGLAVIAVVLWFHFTGRDMPGNLDEMARKAGKAAAAAVEKTGEAVEKGGELMKKLDQQGD